MDQLLKGLKLSDDKKDSSTDHHPVTEAHNEPTPGHTGHGLLNKIGDALSGGHHTEQVITPPPAQQSQQHDKGHAGLFDKITNSLSGEHKHETRSPPPEPKHEGLLHHITGALGGHGDSQPAAAAPPPPTEPKHEDLLDKIGSTLGGHHEQAPPPPPSKPEGLIEKLTSTFTGGHPASHAPETAHSDEGNLLHKIGGAIKGEHTQEPPKRTGIVDKINSALGGGEAGEKKEDALDKAVDLVQEHVLHQGQQKNESALEQAKDEQISDVIRHEYQKLTGHHFPIPDKS